MAVAALAGAANAQNVGPLTFLGEETFATNLDVNGTNMGGLSGIKYDGNSGKYYAISDDRSSINPARWYELSIDSLANGAFGAGSVKFNGFTTLRDAGGNPYAANSLDPEGITMIGNRVFVSSEGDKGRSINPFVNEYDLNGILVAEFTIPGKYNVGNGVGIRNNLAFETLTATPGGSIFTATENALLQDGDIPTMGAGTPARILKFDAAGNPLAEYVYETDPLQDQEDPPGSFNTNGLVEMLAITENSFLALERSFANGVGNDIRIYEGSLSGATDVLSHDSLLGKSYTPVSKRLVLDLDDLSVFGINYLDNIEGMTWGPTLANGKRSLLLVSDNNFSSTQVTQFLAFETDVVPEPASMEALAIGLAALARRRRK